MFLSLGERQGDVGSSEKGAAEPEMMDCSPIA